MVKKRVIEAHTSEGEKEVGRALGKLDRVSLHHIRGAEEIRAICAEVINRTEGAVSLVQITPARLEALKQQVQKKVRHQLHAPPDAPEINEVEVMRQSALIRSDWSSSKWKKHPPHGWAWREETERKGKREKGKKEVVALVYETRDRPNEHEIFLDKEILLHPRGALALIKNMRKRHKALMAWDKRKTK